MANLPEILETFTKGVANGGVRSLADFLPLLRLEDKPMNLRLHFFFAPLFLFDIPRRIIFKTARQVGKSQSIGSVGTLQSGFIKNFHTLFIQPRFDQIKFFSNSIVKPLINHSYIKSGVINRSCEENVLIRTFANGSRMHFGFCFLDADRIRGIAAVAKCCIDESISEDTLIEVLTTSKNSKNKGFVDSLPIKDLPYNQPLNSITTDGRIIESTTEHAASFHGYRQCFTVELEDGRTLTATMEHGVGTTQGWKTIGELIEYGNRNREIERQTDPNGNGDVAGGRMCDGSLQNIRGVSQQTRLVPARIQLDQVSDIIGVRDEAAREEKELRLRGMVERVVVQSYAGIQILARPLLPRRTEDGDPSLVGHAGLGGGGLVGDGRRLPTKGESADDIHARVHQAGGGAAGPLAEPTRGGVLGDRCQQKGQDLLGAATDCEGHPHTDPAHQTLRAGGDGLQDRLGVETLSEVRSGAFRERPGVSRLPAGGSFGEEARILRGEQRGASAEEQRMGPGASGACAGTCEGSLPRGYREVPQIQQGISGQTTQSESREDAREEAGLQGPHEGRSGVREEAQGGASTLLREGQDGSGADSASPGDWKGTTLEAQGAGEGGSQSVAPGQPGEVPGPAREGETPEIVAVGIKSITYAGVRRVYDVGVVGTRSYIANGIVCHNCQDIDNDNIPVIGQTMAAQRKYGVFQFTGTPKTTDNTLSLLFDDSSAAEWVIPCKACNKLNVPCVSQDLLNMIGKETCVCAKCGKPLDARNGWFEHANPSKRWEFPGYHVSQIIHPLHYTDPSKWRELLYNMHTYQKARFWNEILGEPCDESVKLVTVQDIQKASRGGLNNLQEAVKRRASMETVVLGVDWGGKGSLENSFTVVTAVGWRPGSDTLECIYAERFPIGAHELDENRWIMEYSSSLKASFVAHDYTGAGAMREIFLVQGGMEESRMAPFTYTNTPRQEVIKYCPPGAGTRRSWSIDKTQSYVILINMLKGGKVILPEFESSFEVTKDLLSLVEDVKEMPFTSNMYRIGKTPKKSDDFASALNLACSAIWHIKDCYPTVVDAERYKVSREAMEAANPARVNWR